MANHWAIAIKYSSCGKARMKDSDLLMTLLWQFMLLSFVAIGGANAALPEIHRQVVDIRNWIGDKEFSELFAIAQAAPGPNVIVVTLIGWKIAGLAGAFITTIGMCAPSSLLAYFTERLSNKFKASRVKQILQKSFAPITIGIILASGYLLAGGVEQNWKTIVTILVSICAILFTRINLVVLLMAGALMGVMGII